MTPAPHVAAFLISFLTSFAVTPIVGRLATRTRFYALPVTDRWHTHPVPLLGGVAIVIAFVLGLVTSTPGSTLLPVLLCSGLMFLLGVVDDVRPIAPASKLVVQMLIAGTVLSTSTPIAITGWPVIDQLLAFTWIIGITNAFNLLDNMDGLAAGVAAIAGACCLALLLPAGDASLTIGVAAFVGGVAGFLIYNFPPASIFMGDGGSHFLGAFLASASLFATPGMTGQLVPAAVFPLLILLVPIFDTTFVTLTRRLSGRSALIGGRDHTSHRLVALGVSVRLAVLSLYLLAVTGGLLAIALRHLQVSRGRVDRALRARPRAVVVVLGHVAHRSSRSTQEMLLLGDTYRCRTPS